MADINLVMVIIGILAVGSLVFAIWESKPSKKAL